MSDALLVLIFTASACSVLGVFLILRGLSMLTDAISHTVLLGIVLAFFLTRDLTSPFLLIGAALMGVFTVYCIETLGRTGLVHYEDSIGSVFPLLFSLAVILISKYARNVHLDTDMVLMGEVIYAGLRRTTILGLDIAESVLKMGILLVLSLAYILVFYRELKVSTFDLEFSKLIGIPAGIFFYTLMTLTSLTTVAAFDSVGSILVISFFIAPPACALMVTKKLHAALIVSLLFAAGCSALGYYLALSMNVSMSGMCAFINMLACFVTMLFNREGAVTMFFRRFREKSRMKETLMLIHIGNHTSVCKRSDENRLDVIGSHLNWRAVDIEHTSRRLIASGDLMEKEGYLLLSDRGKEKYTALCGEYGLD